MKKNRLQSIKSARSLKDLGALLKEINAEVADLDSQVEDVTLSVSAGNITALDDLELDPKAKTRISGGGLPNRINNYKKPDIKALVQNSKTLERFAQDIAELEALRNVLLSEQFSALPNTDKLRREAEKSIKEAKASRDRQLKAMKLAVTNKPTEAKKFTSAINKHLLSLISDEEYSELKQYSFVLLPEGRSDVIWYQTYVTLRDLVVGNDFVFDRYTFVLTTQVDIANGDLQHFITTLKSEAVPGSFSPGTEVKSSSKARQVINTYLTADDFNVDHGSRVALQPTYDRSGGIIKKNRGVTTADLRHRPLNNKTSFALGDFDIAKVRIQNDKIYFRFEDGVDQQEVRDYREKILIGLRTYLGGDLLRRNALTTKIESRQGRIYLVVSVIPPKNKSQKLMSNIDQFATRFELDGTSKARLKRFMLDG